MGFALHYNKCCHGSRCSNARHQSSAFYSFAYHPSAHHIPWHPTCQGVQELYTAAIRSRLRQHEMIWTRINVTQCTLEEVGKIGVHWMVNWLKASNEKDVAKKWVPPLVGIPQCGDKGNATIVFVWKIMFCMWQFGSHFEQTFVLVQTQTQPEPWSLPKTFRQPLV